MPATPRSRWSLGRRSRSSSDARERLGWTVPWYSSAGNRWPYDFHATMDESVVPVQYNYQAADALRRAGTATAH